MPHVMGGLPAAAPPRRCTPEYDAMMRKRAQEQRRRTPSHPTSFPEGGWSVYVRLSANYSPAAGYGRGFLTGRQVLSFCPAMAKRTCSVSGGQRRHFPGSCMRRFVLEGLTLSEAS